MCAVLPILLWEEEQSCPISQRNLWSGSKIAQLSRASLERLFSLGETNLYQKGRAEGGQQVATLPATWEESVDNSVWWVGCEKVMWRSQWDNQKTTAQKTPCEREQKSDVLQRTRIQQAVTTLKVESDFTDLIKAWKLRAYTRAAQLKWYMHDAWKAGF